MAVSFRRSGFAVALYALLAVVILWLGVSLIGNLDLGGPPNPFTRFGSAEEVRQYFNQHPSEIAEPNRAVT